MTYQQRCEHFIFATRLRLIYIYTFSYARLFVTLWFQMFRVLTHSNDPFQLTNPSVLSTHFAYGLGLYRKLLFVPKIIFVYVHVDALS